MSDDTETRVIFEGGKYTFIIKDGQVSCLHYFKPWRRFAAGDKAIIALVSEIHRLQQLETERALEGDLCAGCGRPCALVCDYCDGDGDGRILNDIIRKHKFVARWIQEGRGRGMHVTQPEVPNVLTVGFMWKEAGGQKHGVQGSHPHDYVAAFEEAYDQLRAHFLNIERSGL